MSMLGEVVVKLTAVTSGLKQGLNDAQHQLKDLQKQVKASTEGFAELGAAAAAAGIGIATGLGFAVVKAADFEKQMSRVAALSGATNDELVKMRDTAMQLGASTSFSASQVAAGMQYLAMAGYKTNDIIAAMPGLLATAAAGQIDLATASDITSNILTAFGIAASDTGRVADVLTKTFTSSNTTLTELGYAMKYVGPVAKAAGLSLEEMAAAMGLLGNAGIKGEQAGTTLRGIILQLIDPPKEVAKKMEELGLKTVDASGKMVPLHDIIGQLKSSMSGMSDAQKAATASLIVGREAASGFLALLDSGQETLVKFTKELENSGGTADEIAKVQLDNLKGSWEQLSGALETLAINIGTVLIPAIRALVEATTEIINKFNQLSPAVQKAITITLAVVSAVLMFAGAVAIVISLMPKIIAGIKALGAAFTFLATNPIGMVITAIGLVIVGAVALYHAWTNNMGGIQTKTHAVGRYLVSLWNDVMNKMATASNQFQRGVMRMLQFLMNAISPVVSVIGKVAPGVETLFDKAKQAVNRNVDDISLKLDELKGESAHTSTQLDIASEQVKRAFSSWKTPATSAAKSADELGGSAKSTATDLKGLVNPSDLASKGVTNVGDAFDETAKKAKKGAEDTRSEWEKAVDTLTMKLQILQATHEVSNVRLGENAEQAKKLNNDLFYLRKEYDLQAQVVDKARINYEQMMKTKGEVSKETAEAAQKYAQEAKTLSDLSSKIAETNLALQQRKWVTDEARESLEILKAEHEKQTANLSIEAGKLSELQLKQTHLNQTLDAQRVLISDLNSEYEVSRKVKGADSEETRKSYMELIRAQTEEAKLQRELRETAKAIGDQTNEFNKLSLKVEELAKKYKDELSKAQSEYARKVEETNQKLADDERRLTETYESELDNRTKALRDFVGLFDSVQRNDVSGSELLDNLRGQVDAMQDFDSSIGALAGRGVSEGLLEELKSMGPKAVSEIQALSSMSDVELSEYTRLWEEKSMWARRRATEELQGLRIETQQKIAELRKDAADQLEQYRLEWQKKTADIRTNTAKDLSEIVENARKSGGDMVSTFIDGIRSKFQDLRDVMTEMAGIADSYLPHSPAKVGPLSSLNETGVGLIDVFAKGIKKSLPQLDAVTNQMASLVASKLPGPGAYDTSGNVRGGGNTIAITIQGADSNEVMDKLERNLKRWGLI